MVRLRNRSERRRRVLWVADHVPAHERLARVDEPRVDRAMNVDALDGAAALPRIVDGTVDDVLDGPVEIAVGGDVSGVVAPELEPDLDQALGGRRGDAMTSEHRAGVDDVVD